MKYRPQPTVVRNMSISIESWYEEVFNLVPNNWEVGTWKYQEGKVVYLQPHQWKHGKWCIYCNPTIVQTREQVQACLDYWNSTATRRKEFKEYAEKNRNAFRSIEDNLYLQLPRFE